MGGTGPISEKTKAPPEAVNAKCEAQTKKKLVALLREAVEQLQYPIDFKTRQAIASLCWRSALFLGDVKNRKHEETWFEKYVKSSAKSEDSGDPSS